jgi:hypothetical protein
MKTLRTLVAAGAMLLLSQAAGAVNVPLPIEGATLNITPHIQSQVMLTENGTPDGQSWATDIFARRTRLYVTGDISPSFSYYFLVDNPNFGKFGDYGAAKKLIVQDGFVSWAPIGKTGGTVLYIDAGLQFVPFTRETFTSIASKPSVEGHNDLVRGFTAAFFSANRSNGLQVRGWLLDKKIGFRGGIFEGQQPTAVNTLINSRKNPLVAGFVQFNILGTQEGAFVYQSIYFSKEPLLSVAVSGAYQSRALSVPKGITDQKGLTGIAFLEYPFSEDVEVIAQFEPYLYGNGAGSKDTGFGWGADLAIRYKWIKPYVSYETFSSDDCPGDLNPTVLATCQGPTGAHSADSRNLRAGLDFFINKSANHVMLEFSVNHGQSIFGPQSITAAAAGYVPLSLDPVLAGGPRVAMNTTLAAPAQKSLLLHWNVSF